MVILIPKTIVRIPAVRNCPSNYKTLHSTMKIRTKLVIAFLCVGIVPLITLSFLSIKTTSLELETQAMNMVKTVSDHKRSAIEAYFETCKSQAKTFSNSKMVIDTLYAIDEFYYTINQDNGYTNEKLEDMRKKVKAFYVNEFGSKYKKLSKQEPDVNRLVAGLDDTALGMQYLYVSENPHPIGSKDQLDNAGDLSRYSTYHQSFHPEVRQYLQEFGYYDLFLISPEGRVVYSSYKQVDFGTSLLTGSYTDTNLAWVVRKALQAGKAGNRDQVFMVDYEPYKPSYEQPSSFSASPVIKDGKCIGAVVMKMSLERLAAVMANDSGLGESGDSYLVGADYLLRSDSHKVKELTVEKSFAQKKQIKNEVIETVLEGKTVAKIFKNLSGKEALIAGKPVTVGGYTWALIDEIEMEEAMALVSHLQWSVSILSIVSGVIVLILSLYIAYSIIKPIDNMGQTLKEIASGNGDLTKRLSIKSNDEVGKASKAFNTFMDKLNQIIVSLADNTRNLGKASDQLAHSSDSMAKNTTGMDGKITNVAAAGEELSVNIQSMSQGAEQISTSAKEVAEAVNDLRGSIEKVSSSCTKGAKIAEEANAKTQSTSKDIHELGKVAYEIEGVVDLIRNVADQTNLLALNANIEAASAGEAGQGFAVVANEVKELAQKTTDATREIEGKISQIRDRIQISIKSITEVSKVIEDVNVISADISDTMKKQSTTTNGISTAVKEVSDSSELMAKNVEESANGASEISQNIIGISESAKMSKEVANDTNDQSKKLSDSTDVLNEIVKQFKY